MGALVALTGWKRAREGEKVLNSYLTISAGLCGLIFSLDVTYFLIKYPDWMWSYFIDSREVPSTGVIIFFIIFVCFSALTGSVITQLGIRERNFFFTLFPFIFGFSLYIFVWGITWDQYFHVGTYMEYHSGKAVSLNESDIKRAMSTYGTGAVLPYIGVYFYNIYYSFLKRKKS